MPADYSKLTLAALTNDVLTGLGEALDSTAGELAASHSFSPPERPEETTRQLIARLLNQGAARLCREGAFFLYRNGTWAGTPGDGSVPLSSLTTADGSVLWGAEVLAWQPDAVGGVPALAPTALTYISRGRVLLRAGQGAASPGVAYWSRSDGTVRLWDAPAASGTLSALGPALPPRLVLDADAPTWLPPDMTRLLVTFARAELAKKADKAVIVRMHVLWPRVQQWEGEWQQGVAALQARQRAALGELYDFHMGPGMPPMMPKR